MLVQRAKSGDGEAFAELIDQNKIKLYKVARAILKNDHDANDAISESILAVYEKLYTLKNDEYFSTWLIRILINNCYKIIKRSQKVVQLEDYGVTYDDEYQNQDLLYAISQLGDEHKVVCVLFYYDDMPTKQIAAILKISEGTVKSRLSRAREKLAELMKEVV